MPQVVAAIGDENALCEVESNDSCVVISAPTVESAAWKSLLRASLETSNTTSNYKSPDNSRHSKVSEAKLEFITRLKRSDTLTSLSVKRTATFATSEALLGGLDRKNFTQRIQLEISVIRSLPRILLFFFSFVIFLIIQHMEHNPEAFADTNSGLRHMFDLEADSQDASLYDAKSYPKLVLYLESFAQEANTLNPLSKYHWCPIEEASPLSLNIPERIRCRRPDSNISFTDHFEGVGRATKQRKEILERLNFLSGDTSQTRRLTPVAVQAQTQKRKPDSSPQQSGDLHSPRTRRIELAIPVPPSLEELERFGNRTVPISKTSGVVGFATNGVLLIGRHHHLGMPAKTSWHFDDCGGHADTDGWYHYHFPPSCFLRAVNAAGPSSIKWWFDSDADEFWPKRAEPSPVLGHALDGLPIYGPYDHTGKLVNSAELDECNGHAHIGPAGVIEYHYHWTAMAPFLPSCFRGNPIQLNLSEIPAGHPCPSNGMDHPPAYLDSSTLMGVRYNVFRASGCPDHEFFQSAVHVEKVSPFVAGSSEKRLLTGFGCDACKGQRSCASCSANGTRCNSCGVGKTCSGACTASQQDCTTYRHGSGGCNAKCKGSASCNATHQDCTASRNGTGGCNTKCKVSAGSNATHEDCSASKHCTGGCNAKCKGSKGCNAAGDATSACSACAANAGSLAQVVGSMLIAVSDQHMFLTNETVNHAVQEAVALHVSLDPSHVFVRVSPFQTSNTNCSSNGSEACGATRTYTAKVATVKVDYVIAVSGAEATQIAADCRAAMSSGTREVLSTRIGQSLMGTGLGGFVSATLTFLTEPQILTPEVAGECHGGGCCGGGPSIVDIFNPCSAAFNPSQEGPPPQSYKRFHPFAMTNVRVMAPIVWQKRYCARKCDSGFISDFNNQKFNPAYTLPLNAPRIDPLIRCRSEELCNERHLGYEPVIHAGDPLYPVFLDDNVISPIMQYDWIDDLTDEVGVAMLVYTPKFEGLSLLKIRFRFTGNGRVGPSFVLQTHSNLRESENFGVWLALSIIFCLLSLARVAVQVYWEFDLVMSGNIWLVKFDAVHSFAFLAFSTFSICRRCFMTSGLDEVLPLIDVYYSVSDVRNSNEIETLLKRYFQVLEDISQHVKEEEAIKTVAYFMILIAFGRLIVYMSIHPRIAVIAHTIAFATDDIMHFCVAFGFLFFTLAWLALWSFGPDKILFSSFSTALNTCFQMTLGHFPFEEPWKEGVLQKIWYLCFAGLVFFLSLNIFLSIIVEAYLSVKKRVEKECVTERSLLTDARLLIVRAVKSRKNGWPSQLQLAQHLHQTRHFTSPVTSRELLRSHFLNLKDVKKARQLMDFYLSAVGGEILCARGQGFLKEVKEQAEIETCLVKIFRYSASDLELLRYNAVKLQRAWRRHKRTRAIEIGDSVEFVHDAAHERSEVETSM